MELRNIKCLKLKPAQWAALTQFDQLESLLLDSLPDEFVKDPPLFITEKGSFSDLLDAAINLYSTFSDEFSWLKMQDIYLEYPKRHIKDIASSEDHKAALGRLLAASGELATVLAFLRGKAADDQSFAFEDPIEDAEFRLRLDLSLLIIRNFLGDALYEAATSLPAFKIAIPDPSDFDGEDYGEDEDESPEAEPKTLLDEALSQPRGRRK